MKPTLVQNQPKRFVTRWSVLLFAVANCANIAFPAEPQTKPLSAQALDLLAELDKSQDFPGPTPREQNARKRIRDEVSNWQAGSQNCTAAN